MQSRHAQERVHKLDAVSSAQSRHLQELQTTVRELSRPELRCGRDHVQDEARDLDGERRERLEQAALLRAALQEHRAALDGEVAERRGLARELSRRMEDVQQAVSEAMRPKGAGRV
eukprot:NODE_23037_length_683_cov_3.149281.p2 GENE.NODE_23037_length_683_cov_3.149281~~NODE_23037_length_683_cov_3.149281.p2  ORF type:complete len:129 (-),score=50.46 NODE_23037_length_683_cov_3.149281:295-642(-)